MHDYKIGITRHEYEKMMLMDYNERNEIVESKLPQAIICGYGYYGHRLEADLDNGIYYIVCRVGDSCD